VNSRKDEITHWIMSVETIEKFNENENWNKAEYSGGEWTSMRELGDWLSIPGRTELGHGFDCREGQCGELLLPRNKKESHVHGALRVGMVS
jgi:hypothetical protein